VIKLLIGILLFVTPSSNEIDLKVQDYLDLKLKNYESFEFELMNTPEGFSDIKIRSNEEFVLSGPVGYIPVSVVRNDNSEFNSILSVKIKKYAKVLVAINSIDSKTELNPAEFEYKTIDVTSLRGEAITDYLLISSLRSKSFIKAGAVLTQEKAETIPAIFSGDKVVANIKYGNVVVSTDAYARNDGSIGDVISIRTKSNKQFRAKIVDSKNVNIIE
jgi:flagella basal body P-ring formation protein FlgA